MTLATTTADTKLKELMLYVAQRCEMHAFFGSIKLNKILLYSDWNAFTRRGHAITGATYVKEQFGPVPRGIKGLISAMETNNDAVVVSRVMPDMKTQDRLVARRDPNLSIFDPEEIAIVDQVIEWIRPMTARKISNLTHKCVGWNAANYDEVIPYSAALIPDSPIPLSPEELDHGIKLGQKIAERALSAG